MKKAKLTTVSRRNPKPARAKKDELLSPTSAAIVSLLGHISADVKELHTLTQDIANKLAADAERQRDHPQVAQSPEGDGHVTP